MSALRTEYEFVLPRGYLDRNGELHKKGIMRLATARDELEPLRDPTITSADDPRLTILVLARVVRRLGTLELVTANEIENLFAADLAYLQDFYGVINFGTPGDIEALLDAQKEMERAAEWPAPSPQPQPSPAAPAAGPVATGTEPSMDDSETRAPVSRRAAIEEVPSNQR
ncbi:MAG TPA: hypothetical protein VFN61_00140 [Acidimicrobiales bacterium]|nr:hypothetical protein [Acidimicrobiales bacterium]